MKKYGSNESSFREYIKNETKANLEDGIKLSIKNNKDNSISTSYDFSFVHKNIKYLIEVDSYNMSKCLLGQYVLLNNTLPKIDSTNTIFVVVHFYKDFNASRTINHLNFAMKNLNCKIPFVAFHFKDLKKASIKSVADFAKFIDKHLN
jgi:hypothetical protein